MKKVSYFFAISLISALAILSKAYAMYDNDLIKEIDGFIMRQKQPKDEKAPEGLWYYVNAISQETGGALRSAGHIVRTYIHQTSGNVMRRGGEALAGEEPALERTIRDYWLRCDPIPFEETILTSTACSLYSSTALKEGVNAKEGAAQVIDGYVRFVETWNRGSITKPFKDKESIAKCFLNGIIKAMARQNLLVKSFGTIEQILLDHEIDIDRFITRPILTEDVLREYERENNGYSLTQQALQERLVRERQDAFMIYFRGKYAKEQNFILLK